MRYEILTEDRFSECEDLLSRETSYKRSYGKPSTLLLRNYYFNLDVSNFKIFGCFDRHDILVACVFVRYSLSQREYMIEYIAKLSRVNLDVVVGIFDFIMTYSEDNAFYKCSHGFLISQMKPWESLLRKSDRFKRYDTYTETVIPRYQRSSYAYYWINHQKTSMSVQAMVVRNYLLREEFRTFEDLLC